MSKIPKSTRNKQIDYITKKKSKSEESKSEKPKRIAKFRTAVAVRAEHERAKILTKEASQKLKDISDLAESLAAKVIIK